MTPDTAGSAGQDRVTDSAAPSPVPDRFRSTSAPSFAGLPYDQQPRTVGTLDTSKEFGVHLRAWAQGQVAFADAILAVAQHLDHDQLVLAIEHLRATAAREVSRYV